jgi:hypothetical protein
LLAHEIFDPEHNKRVLVDHAFIVAGGEITKAARNWTDDEMRQTSESAAGFPTKCCDAGNGGEQEPGLAWRTSEQQLECGECAHRSVGKPPGPVHGASR